MAPTAVSQLPRPPKPTKIRYFKNKPLADVPSDSESEEDEAPQPKAKAAIKIDREKDENLVAGGAGRIITAKDVKRGVLGVGVKMSLGDVKIGGKEVKKEVKAAEEESSEEEETDDEEEEVEEVKPRFVPKAPGEEVSLPTYASTGVVD